MLFFAGVVLFILLTGMSISGVFRLKKLRTERFQYMKDTEEAIHQARLRRAHRRIKERSQ